MKKIIYIYSILILFCSNLLVPSFSEEIQEEIPQTEAEEEMFAPVDLDLTDYTQMNKQTKKFKLSAEKEGKPTYVKNTGQVWSEDKIFLQNYYGDESNIRMLPSYGTIGNYLNRDLDENTSITVGQSSVDKINGETVNFAYDNYSYYAVGSKLDRQGEKFNYSLGAYNETDTTNQQLAAVISTKPKSILNSKGKFYVGSGVFSTLMNDLNFTTTGAFAQYTNKRLSIGTQISNSAYSKEGYSQYNKAHLLTRFQVNEHLSLKNKIIKNFDVEEIQGELGVVLNPLKDTDRWELEVTAANYQSQNVVTRQRLKFSTSFRF